MDMPYQSHTAAKPKKRPPCLFEIKRRPFVPSRRIQLPLKRPLDAGIGDHWFNFGGVWTVRVEGSRIVFPALEKRSREVGMQSEPGWPRIILDVYPRPPGEEGATDRDSFMRTGRTCMSTRSLFFRLFSGPLCQTLLREIIPLSIAYLIKST